MEQQDSEKGYQAKEDKVSKEAQMETEEI